MQIVKILNTNFNFFIMETSKTAFLNISLKYGLIVAGLLILLTVLVYVLGINMFSIAFSLIYFPLIIAIVAFFMVKGMNTYKRSLLGGQITYLQCFISGFVLALAALWISGIFGYILYGLIDTEYLPNQIEKFAEMLQGYGMSADKVEEQVLKVQEKMDPMKQMISSLYTSPIAAAIVSAIVSIFIKKNDNIIPQDIIR